MLLINNKEYQLPLPQNILELLNSLNIEADKGVAIAINNTVIPKNIWDNYLVNDNDKLLIIKAAQGG